MKPVYDFLLSLGMLSDSNATMREKSKSKVNPYQSAFNKLLQFGSSARATKTAGSYGEMCAQPTTSQWSGASLEAAQPPPRKGSSSPLVALFNHMRTPPQTFAYRKDGVDSCTVLHAGYGPHFSVLRRVK